VRHLFDLGDLSRPRAACGDVLARVIQLARPLQVEPKVGRSVERRRESEAICAVSRGARPLTIASKCLRETPQAAAHLATVKPCGAK